MSAIETRVGLLGYGRVGQAVARGIERHREHLAAAGVSLTCVGALVRDPDRERAGPAVPCTTEARQIIARADLLIEVLGGLEPAATIVTAALEAGLPVVTANKTLVAHEGRRLRALAAARGTAFTCEAAVLAGVPFLAALTRRPLLARVRRLAGILNGTSQFVACATEDGTPFGEALCQAVAAGYAEPDSEADVSGRDAAEKLTVLLHLAGACGARADRLPAARLDVVDIDDVETARLLGGVIRPVALASLDAGAAGAWVGPAFIERDHPFARLRGVQNALALTDALGQAVTFAGPGAGPDATALTLIDDAAEVVLHGCRAPRARRADACPTRPDAPRPFESPPPGPWFVRVEAANGLTVRRFADSLEAAGAPAVRLTARRRRIAARTAAAPWTAVRGALAAFGASADALVLPVLDDHPPASKETRP